MGLFRDLINEARNTSVPTEYRIALGQLKRMYNAGEVPSEKELQKDAEMIAKKNHLEEDKFFEFAKSQFKINESVDMGNELKKLFGLGKSTREGFVWSFDDGSKFIVNSKNIEVTKYVDKNNKEIIIKDPHELKKMAFTMNESAVGKPGRTTEKDAEDHIDDELVAEFKKIIKKLGGKTVAKVLLDKLGQKPEIKDEIEHIEDIIDNSNY